ncbi:hypothetical protein BDZ89DRAFT_1133714 [Hymenopellis radicata]|nr:hypothetical protein BDZ89DRAFT_1133714 [Hymenopellis radicata]
MKDDESFDVSHVVLAKLLAPPVAAQPSGSAVAPPVTSAVAPPVTSAAPPVTSAVPPQVYAPPVTAVTDTLSNITPAGPIPPSALQFMTAATIEALGALDLDTVPSNPNMSWYTVTVGTWIGISDDWSFVSFHVSGVSRAAYRREDSWMEARSRFLRARDQGVCRLV